MAPDEIATIVGVLRRRAAEQPNRVAYIFLADGETETGRLTYEEVDRRARAVAEHLQAHGAAGERALITYPSDAGAAYVVSFIGCLYAGVIAIPCDAARGKAGIERLSWIVHDSAPRFVLAPETDHAALAALGAVQAIDVDSIDDTAADGWRDPALTPDMLALLQYTSGSTRSPRGVMVSHANVMANEHAIATTCRHDGDSVFVGWLPLFHDMGMIANVLQPPYLGSTSVLLPPSAFLARPARWLAAFGRYGGVTGGGPNFAYDVCVSRVTADEIEKLDLSTWRVAFNGAEVVRADTLRRFTDRFGPAGFSPETFFPCYGLAEATLIVAGAPRGVTPRTYDADPFALTSGRLVPALAGSPAHALVSSGEPVHATQVAIVDPAGNELPEGTLGEVWVRGPGVAGGYWHRPEETTSVFGGRLAGTGVEHYFLRTGDLGAFRDGELYLVGRLKDLVIIRGQNYSPDDLEWTAETSHPGLRPSCGAAFSVDGDDGERLVVLYEVTGSVDQSTVDEIATAVRRAVATRHRIEVDAVALTARGSIPKTTSGKVRRLAAREAYLRGVMPLVGMSVRGPVQGVRVSALPDLDLLALEHRVPALAAALQRAVGERAGLSPPFPDVAEPISTAGLDSLAATELQHRIQRRYGVQLPPLSLLGDTTFLQLAAGILSALRAGPAGRPGLDDLATPRRAGPLTAVQRALWYECQLAPPGPAYSLVRAVRVNGRLDRAGFDRAAHRLVERHAALRTRFAVVDGEPVQHVTDHPLEISHEQLLDDEAALHARLAHEAARGFSLTDEPLVRLTVLHLDPDATVLLLAAHHVIADFWSLVVVLRELMVLYAEESGGPSAALAPLRTTLIAQAESETARAGTPNDERAWSYWQRRLSGAPTALAMPLDRARPPRRGFRGGIQPVVVGPELTRRLHALAREQRTTLVTTVLSAFQVLLSRHSASDDVIVGVLTGGRDSADLVDVVGCFVNPVPVRATVVGSESFRTLLQRNREDVLADLAQARYPFSRLVSRLDPPRVPGLPPLIQAMLVFQQEHGQPDSGLRAMALGVAGTIRLGDTTVESVPVQQPWTHVDLTLNLAEIDGVLAGTIEYDLALFDESTIAGISRRFVHLLGQLAQMPDQPLDAVSSLPPTERAAVRAAGRGPQADRPHGATLHGLVFDRARECGDRVAVTLPRADGGTDHLTYRALRQWSGRLANQLEQRGVGPESRVGVFLERSLALPVAALAVLRRGATYLPLDPADPPERLAWLVTDANVAAVITTGHLRARLPIEIERVLTVDAADLRRPARAASLGRTSPDNAAYVMYTSGSTGRPKGVVVPHRGIANRLLWMQETLALTAADRVVHKAPTTFDVSLWELFWPLISGACLVLAPPERHRDPLALAELFRREQVSTAHFVPSLLTAFLSGGAPGELPALTRLVCSGEALPARLRDDVRTNLTARLYNLYGPTETSVDVTAWECHPGETGSVPIGHAVANTEVHVLDAALQPLPANVCGEILVGGVALARGYLGRPGLTAAAFIPDPCGAAGTRLYRTGDQGRRRPDGAIEFVGRTDLQVKIAGNRVELGEVEEALRGAPGVRQAVVVLHGDGSGPQLIAYIVGGDSISGDRDLSSIMSALRARLPAAMVPALVIPLSSLPLTPTGKVDRRSLPAPEGPASRPGTTDPDATPRSEIEQDIADVWTSVLGQGPSMDVDFFSAGGDSISALRMVALLHEAGVALSVSDLASGATLGQLAHLARSTNGPAETVPNLEPFALCPPELAHALPPEIEDAFPITRAQRAVLFHQMHSPGHEVYVTSLTVRARFDATALRAAVDSTMRRHPYLRSSFDLASHTEPLQLVHRTAGPPLTLLDLHDWPRDTQEAVIADWIRGERKRPIDVTVGSLVRFCVHRRDVDLFQFTVSSFALDGWATATVLTELLTEYAARLRGEPTGSPTPSLSYATFVALEEQTLRSPAARSFWAQELDDVSPCLVPRTSAGPAAALTHRHVYTVDSEVAAALRRIARELAVPLKSVLLAAHVRVVRQLTAQTTVVTGLEMHGRPAHVDADRVVGVFNNIVPFRIDVSGGSWTSLIRAAAAGERRVLPHRRYPLAELERDHRVKTVFNTVFVFTQFRIYERLAALDDLQVIAAEAPDRTYFPLTAHFNVDAVTGDLRLLLDYDPGEVTDEAASATLGYYQRALSRLASEPDRPHSAETLLSAHEVVGQLRAGTSPRPVRSGGTVHEEILRQVARTPDAVAIADADGYLTYRGLAKRSGRLARALVASGVTPDSLVAIRCRRGLDLLIGMLAVLRAGGAYVPIDPAMPVDRLAVTVSRSGIRVIVSGPDVDDGLAGSCTVVRPDAAALRTLPRVHPAGLAYGLHTSGTTGRPKLIGVPHEAVVNYLRWCVDAYRPSLGGRTPLHSPIEFDLSVTSALAPLVAGGTVLLVPPDAGPERLGEILATVPADVMKITPAHFEAVGSLLRQRAVRPTVGCVVLGGEQLRAAHLDPWRGLLDSTPIFNEYGPTEATVGCSAHRLDPAVSNPDRDGDAVPIGRPITGASAHVLDDALAVPIGVVSELYVGGVGLARGYLGQPGPTADRFVPDPYGSGARLYRTGDLARLGDDGHLRFVGRRDRQLKVRGHRIEPDEIELELRRHPAVRDAAVTALPEAAGHRRLAAYWVPSAGASPRPDAAELADWLARRVPGHLVPDVLIELPMLPLTSRGKVDYARLPEPGLSRRDILLALVESTTDDTAQSWLAEATPRKERR